MDDALHDAAQVLCRGGVVAHACEGVWGLACNPLNEAAVGRVLDVKGRPAAKGLIVIAASADAFAAELGALDEATAERIRASWPGPVTWVVRSERFPNWITGGRGTVAVRVPDHAQSRALSSAFGGPIVSTSANRSGAPPCLTAESVREALGDEIDYLLSGAIGDRSGPSRIIDAATGETLR
ncbi:MAG: Sua5/YciO/YrdC/YwlC family protein [Gammaproteobacteria bacterium]|nr:Sua5/YciO/YrdC/YwlC family protein [Gammaproteobacteria bacterium]